MRTNNIPIIKTLIIAIVFAMMFLAVTVGADPGLPGGYAKIKDWDQAHEAFSFSLGEVPLKVGTSSLQQIEFTFLIHQE